MGQKKRHRKRWRKLKETCVSRGGSLAVDQKRNVAVTLAERGWPGV